MSRNTVNYFRFEGNLGDKPLLKTTSMGAMMAVLSLATLSSRKNDKDEWENRADWHRVIAFGELAEQCINFDKGSWLAIEGVIKPRSYEDSEGNKKHIIDFVAQDIEEKHANTDGQS